MSNHATRIGRNVSFDIRAQFTSEKKGAEKSLFGHYSIRTEQAYIDWIKRFIIYHRKRHPGEMAEQEVAEFITHLARDLDVAASTQNQALSALLFDSFASRSLSLAACPVYVVASSATPFSTRRCSNMRSAGSKKSSAKKRVRWVEYAKPRTPIFFCGPPFHLGRCVDRFGLDFFSLLVSVMKCVGCRRDIRR